MVYTCNKRAYRPFVSVLRGGGTRGSGGSGEKITLKSDVTMLIKSGICRDIRQLGSNSGNVELGSYCGPSTCVGVHYVHKDVK